MSPGPSAEMGAIPHAKMISKAHKKQKGGKGKASGQLREKVNSAKHIFGAGKAKVVENKSYHVC